MLGLDLLAAHLVGDFLLQTQEMADRKLHDWYVRLFHVLLYLLPFQIVLMIHGQFGTLSGSVLFIPLLFVLHFITDSRRWASGEKWPPKPIVVDQTLHVVQLALLSRLLVP